MTSTSRAPRAAVWLGWLLLALLVVRLWDMSALPLMDTTEARYAEIARKMAAWGDWVTPWHDDGVPFWGKPPLSFWLTALSFKLWGVSEFTARLPHLLCGLATLGLVWHVARQRSPREARLAAGLLAGSAVFTVSSGAVMTDAALVLTTTAVQHSFWLSMQATTPQATRRQAWWFFVALALGLLAKGPIAVVLSGVPLALWLTWERRWQEAWQRLPWLPGLALMAVLTAPWYAMAEHRTPGFLNYFVLGEHWHRFVTPGWPGDRYGTAHAYPPGTIWVFAALALLPWSLLLWPVAAFAPRAVAAPSADRAWRRYLWLWALTPLLFFTVARNIIWPYALPAAPALALLWASWLAHRSPRAETWVNGGLVLGIAALAVLGSPWITASQRVTASTAKGLVAAYQAHRSAGQPLVYLGHRPFSAAFYSSDQARWARQGDDLAAQVPAAGAWVAVPITWQAPLPGVQVDADLGVIGDFTLYRVHPAATP